jgi:alanyl aminopeptidase
VSAALASPDRRERADIYGALGNFRTPELAQAGRALWLSPAHDVREVMTAARARGHPERVQESLFQFMDHHLTDLSGKLPTEMVARFPHMFAGACTQQQAQKLEALFTPWLARVDGMAKSLEQSLETVRLCAHYRAAQQTSLKGFLKPLRPTL